MRFRLSVLFCCAGFALFAQPDSSLLLKPERLSESNIRRRDPGQQKVKSVTATRSLEAVDNLPFTVWVVSAEEILRNGYVTLGDVLRAAPGVRVSQPGNALEGETFMMRGLPGNSYVKILINDVPVKPSVAPGMPIGAQIPIRQAERIEVLYGPASALYGDEACAGVVNIILKETERPIFTQADLAFGNYGYNSLDLMLGGKLFKDQKVFRFSLYGSSTVRETADYFYDDRLFTPENYLPFGLDSTVYRFNGNYRPREAGDTVARTAPLPHESRLLGINLTWRNMHFNYNRLERSDHSALGLSPLAQSYANPSNRIAERIETFAFSFQKLRRKRTGSTTLSLIRYQVNETSTFTPIFDRLSTALYYAKSAQIQSDSERQAVLGNIFQRYAANERYYTANGFDFRLESRINAALRPDLYLDAGLQANLGGGVPPMGYFPGPTEVRFTGESTPSNPKPFFVTADGNLQTNVFGQLHWQGKRMKIIGGALAGFALEESPVVCPRLAVLYRLDSVWICRANYSEGFRRSPIYGRVNTFSIEALGEPTAEPFASSLDQVERLRSAEFGLRRNQGNFATDLVFFYQEAYHLTRNGYLFETGDFSAQYGFAQAPGLALSMWGIQGAFGDDILNTDLGRKKNRPGLTEIKAHFDYYFQYSRGREWFGYGLPATRDVRNYSRWMTQLRFSLNAAKWEFITSVNRQNGILSSAVVYRDFYQHIPFGTHYSAYRTWDFMLRLYLSSHFLVYVHCQNFFNRHYAGIDATSTADDLIFNPQPGRTLRFGVNYNMN